MSVNSFEELAVHVGHPIKCVTYGPSFGTDWNVAIECEKCGIVLMDFENPELEDKKNFYAGERGHERHGQRVGNKGTAK